MENILLYPYNRLYESYVRFGCKDIDKRITSLVSPSGWGLVGDCISNKYIVSDNFIEEIDKNDIVWFVEDDRLSLPDKVLFHYLNIAINAKKKILFTRYKNKDQYKKAFDLIPQTQRIFLQKKYLENNEKLVHCYRINCPIIIIMGVEEQTQKFDVQIAITRKLEKYGYKISSISTRNDSEIVNMHSFPSFMMGNQLSNLEKIIRYNHFVKNIEINESPDIIIVGIPGSVIPFNDFFHNDFGILAYMISYAVPCDYAIMCMSFPLDGSGDFSELIDDFKIKFGFNIEWCHISSTIVDTTKMIDEHKISYLTMDKKYINEVLYNFSGRNASYLLKEENCENVANLLIQKLYGEL